jgi:large subunit ribosomal protein L7Ae
VGVRARVQPKADVGRFVRWPHYVRLQRQRKVMLQRLKVPPAVNQFHQPLDKSEAKPVFALLAKYKPESKAAKEARLEAKAASGAAAAAAGGARPAVLKYGLNHITYLVEQKKAQLVVIAADVDPLELVLWLPALCRKMNVPYVIVNNKGRLGELVYPSKGKTATAVALTNVNQEDVAALTRVQETARARFNDNVAVRRKWGGGVMGLKTQAALRIRAEAVKAEEAKKAKY